MAKLGISIKIDVKKILKERLYQGAKGTYVDLTTFIDTDNVDQYDNNGFISQSVSKDERDQGVKTPILGNCKVFFNDSQQQRQQGQSNSQGFASNGQQYGQPQQPAQAPPGYNPNAQGVQQAPQNSSPQPDDFADDIPF